MTQPSQKSTLRIKNDDFQKPEVEQEIKKIKREELSNFKDICGINNQKSIEITTNFDQAPVEKVYEAGTNSFIIIGKDRNAGLSSGYGGKSFTGCGAIDLVAGHMGSRPLETINGQKVFGQKNFFTDSARVYISQMADIDQYFDIPQTKQKIIKTSNRLEDSTAKSAVAATADCVRLVARENVKIVTRHMGRNSKTLDADVGGVDIIAGYNIDDFHHSLQPMVKGDNLKLFLIDIINTIESVHACLATFMEKQSEINRKFLEHKHLINPAQKISDIVINTKTIEQAIQEILTNELSKVKNVNYKFQNISKYFKPENAEYINSRFNRVN